MTQKRTRKATRLTTTRSMADYFNAATQVVGIVGYQVTAVFDSLAVAMVLASLGWTAQDAEAFADRHPDLPAYQVNAVFGALADADVEASTRAPPLNGATSTKSIRPRGGKIERNETL